MHHRRRRPTYWLMLLATAAVPGLLVAMLFSYSKPVGGSIAGVAFASVNGFTVVTLGDQPVAYRPPIAAIGPWPAWEMQGAGLYIAPMSRWHPTRTLASMSFVPAAGPPVTMNARVHWIPTWWLAIVAGIVALVCYWRVRRYRVPGGCDACGYPRRGLAPDAPCPECGAPASDSPAPASSPRG